MRRRSFMAALGGAAMLPFAARAQQAMPVVGFLYSTSLTDAAYFVAAFRAGLKEAGFIEGQNVAVEVRSADNDRDRLAALTTDFISRPVTVFVGNLGPALVAKASTKTVPIVFLTGSDPVEDGLVKSLNRPGGNVTGVSFLGGMLGAKRLEILRQFVPKASSVP